MKMVQKSTDGITVSVQTRFFEEMSDVHQQVYIYAYKISIVNNKQVPVKLLFRKWTIFDSVGTYKIVEGEGVVGEQPIIEPDASYTYSSICNLQSEVGSMRGYYTMENLFDKTQFKVQIPNFELFHQAVLN